MPLLLLNQGGDLINQFPPLPPLHPRPIFSAAVSRENFVSPPQSMDLTVIALKYPLLFKYWELAIKVSKSAAAVEEMVRAQ
jgi:hypothetical protein